MGGFPLEWNRGPTVINCSTKTDGTSRRRFPSMPKARRRTRCVRGIRKVVPSYFSVELCSSIRVMKQILRERLPLEATTAVDFVGVSFLEVLCAEEFVDHAATYFTKLLKCPLVPKATTKHIFGKNVEFTPKPTEERQVAQKHLNRAAKNWENSRMHSVLEHCIHSVRAVLRKLDIPGPELKAPKNSEMRKPWQETKRPAPPEILA